MINTEEDIKKTIEMVKIHSKKNEEDRINASLPIGAESFTTHSKVYPFSNEKVKSYYKKFNYNGNVLTVTGSGDVLLHAILMGCRNITSFDINSLAKYYTILKLTGIKSLNLEEFIYFFTSNGDVGYPNMPYEIFKKIDKHLDYDTSYFWNSMYDEFDINKSKIFQEGFFYDDGEYYNNDYIKSDKYHSLQQILLEDSIIEFIDKSFYDLDNNDLDKEYIAIFLSNIIDYLNDKKYFKRKLETEFVPKLGINGKILYQYAWSMVESRPFRGLHYSTIKTYETHTHNGYSLNAEYAYVYTKK